MEVQNIIVGLIIIASTGFTIKKLIMFFYSPAHKCGGCSGCSLSELKNELELKKKGI